MGPRTVKFPKKGPHFSRFEDGKKGMKKRERKKKKGKRERKKKRKKTEKSGKMKEERERPQITRPYGS